MRKTRNSRFTENKGKRMKNGEDGVVIEALGREREREIGENICTRVRERRIRGAE